jgi:ABC-type nitrate/sulfonate/bicarbonate transport system permease component
MTATAPAAMPLEATPHTAKRATAISRAVGRSLLNALLTFVIVLALWWAVVNLTGISPYVAKGPADVWEFFFTSPEAAENRAEMMPLLAQTLTDAALGFVVGMLVAIVLALAFSLSRSVEMGVMPLALLLRSVPLVAIAPVIILMRRSCSVSAARRRRASTSCTCTAAAGPRSCAR